MLPLIQASCSLWVKRHAPSDSSVMLPLIQASCSLWVKRHAPSGSSVMLPLDQASCSLWIKRHAPSDSSVMLPLDQASCSLWIKRHAPSGSSVMLPLDQASCSLWIKRHAPSLLQDSASTVDRAQRESRGQVPRGKERAIRLIQAAAAGYRQTQWHCTTIGGWVATTLTPSELPSKPGGDVGVSATQTNDSQCWLLLKFSIGRCGPLGRGPWLRALAVWLQCFMPHVELFGGWPCCVSNQITWEPFPVS